MYIVATPIGNLEDITLRAIRILKEVDIIAAEDTRNTLKLLNHLQIAKPMISYHRHNEEIKAEELIQKLLEGKKIALVSDAGTPIISDPGQEIVNKAIKQEIKVISIPGPCALITALVSSGIEAKEFIFLGFLPSNKKHRKEKLMQIEDQETTIILYEAPHKIKQTLEELEEFTKGRKMVLARELTKIHEEYKQGTAKELKENMKEPRGEYVIIIEKRAKTKKQEQIEKRNELSLKEHYQYYEKKGMNKKEIIKQIAKDRNVSKNEIYQEFMT
ncbi:MAG: 16S rRNA (cytidine(1402)-2'-O)-methyltransferase [Clostridia bacterium]|nr:16S rRNA (cytidine(1402)-2'-O)-methyltransferase [Clostridia bacterium]